MKTQNPVRARPLLIKFPAPCLCFLTQIPDITTKEGQIPHPAKPFWSLVSTVTNTDLTALYTLNGYLLVVTISPLCQFCISISTWRVFRVRLADGVCFLPLVINFGGFFCPGSP